MAGVPDPDFIARRTTEVVLPDGTPILMRPITPQDKQRLVDGFGRLSERSRYLRFMSPMAKLTPGMLAYLTEVDYVDHFAWVAMATGEPQSPGVAVARYVRVRDEPEVAEAAVAVIDDFHRRGIGTLLLRALETVAVENGIKRFRAFVLSENREARGMFADLGAHTGMEEPGVARIEVDLCEALASFSDTPMYRVLRAAARGDGIPFLPLTLSREDV